MIKKILIAIAIIAVITIVIFLFFRKPSMPSGIILFYGDGCPHCKNVDDYIAANNVATKVSFEEKEVFNNQSNAKILENVAGFCGLPTDKVSVPFLWDGQNKKCMVGDIDVINFFSEKIK